MNWSAFEHAFLSAWAQAFSSIQFILCFISLILCGLITVFCQTLAWGAGPWMKHGFLFLPLFLSFTILLILGVFLVKLYVSQDRGQASHLKKNVADSMKVARDTPYLSLLPLFIFLLLWTSLGFFFLLKEIPLIGPFFNLIFAAGPFLLIVAALILCISSLGLLFFAAPLLAHQSVKRFAWISLIVKWMKKKPLQSTLLFLVGMLPIVVVGGILSFALSMTHQHFSLTGSQVSSVLEWFFTMIPYCALLTPAILFFFHFSAESYVLLRR